MRSIHFSSLLATSVLVSTAGREGRLVRIIMDRPRDDDLRYISPFQNDPHLGLESPRIRERETEPYVGGDVHWGMIESDKPIKPVPYYHNHLGDNGVPKKKRRR